MKTQPTLDEVRTALFAIHQQLHASFQQGDAAAVAAFYGEDGQIMPAYSAAISGRAAVQAFWQGCFDMGIGAMPRQPAVIDWLTDTVNETGAYRFLDRHNRVLDIGKYVTIWKMRHGQWQIQCDIWTSDLPAGS